MPVSVPDFLPSLTFERGLHLIMCTVGSDAGFLKKELTAGKTTTCVGLPHSGRMWEGKDGKVNFEVCNSVKDVFCHVESAVAKSDVCVVDDIQTIALLDCTSNDSLYHCLAALKRMAKVPVYVSIQPDALPKGLSVPGLLHLSHSVISLEPLTTGKADDVAGQISVYDPSNGKQSIATVSVNDAQQAVLFAHGERTAV